MPAAVYVGDGRIAVEQVPCPEPGPGEVLVEISECGICGSDLHMVLERYAQPGAILGHEWSGTVATAPSGSGWSPGDRVVGNPAPGCGVCRPCRRGRPSVCLNRATADFAGYRGAFCQYKTVAADSLIRIPDSLPTRVAALAEPTAITLHALRLSDVGPDDRVLVTGAGPVGLLLVAVLRAQGISDITVSEPSAVRRQQALDVGATRVVTPDTLEQPPVTQPVAEPYAVVFECSGQASAAEAGFGQLDYAGTLVIVGTGFEPPRLNQNRMIIFELEVIGAYNYNDEGFQPAVDLLATGTLPFDALIEPDNIPLERSDGVHGAARSRRDTEQGNGPTEPVLMSPTPFVPRINHVAISVDAEIMDDEGRAALLDFYSDVFGWIEGDNSTEKGNPLILYTGSLGQFLYLLPAKDEFMVTPNMDHFGIEVSSKAELLEILDRVKAYQSKDDRVRITDVGAMVTRYQDREYTLTNAYVWFLIPLWIELQHVEQRTGD